MICVFVGFQGRDCLLVVVHYFGDVNAEDFNPDVFAVGVGWDGAFVGDEDEAVGMVEVTGPLSFPVSD
jgi:hypothetical protein